MLTSLDLGKTSTLHAPPILKRLHRPSPRVVEVGILRGKLSNFLLRNRPDLSLWMVDTWRELPRGSAGREFADRCGDPCGVLNQDQHDDNRACACAVADKFPGRAVVCATDSINAARIYGSTQFDLVFLDGGHWHDQVVADLDAWWPRVRPGGYIGGHDYGSLSQGVDVVRVVDAWAASMGLTVETDAFFTWFARKPLGGVR